ncbi:MAG TPA: aminoacetone oxidase family FAD-binding enzyme, partial [Ferruginibacter sp.]|nr:aminoacetone oxidase family FAD-binding enzyme [Ferruginibacter sp.]
MAEKNLVVIGGGAAGFFCAVNAARLNALLSVTLLEKSGKLLSKVKVSGGGRCNVTHAGDSIAAMSRQYPRGERFLKKAFHHFFTADTIQWFAERGVELVTEPDGRMFPVSNSSQTIMDCLLSEAGKYKVEIRMNAEVKAIDNQQSDNHRFILEMANGKKLPADYVCIACGGFPKLAQFAWLKELGHSITEPVPSLFTFNIPGNNITSLMGISAEALIKIAGTKLQYQGPLLITHWGFSGPAVLKLSAWGARELAKLNYHFTIMVNWLPAYNEATMKDKLQQVRFEIASQKIINRNPFGLPSRLWEYLLQLCGVNVEAR